MRQTQFALRAVLVLLLLCVTACTTTSAKCRNNRCTVAVKTTSSTSAEILGYQVTFEDLVAGRVTVGYAGERHPIAAGQTSTVGPMTVTVTIAEPGRAELSITADQRGRGNGLRRPNGASALNPEA